MSLIEMYLKLPPCTSGVHLEAKMYKSISASKCTLLIHDGGEIGKSGGLRLLYLLL